MIDRYIRLRQYCQKNEWAAALSALLLICLLGTVIYLTLDHHSTVQHWLSSAVLLNGLIMLLILLALGAFSLSLFCLSFSDCSIEDRTEKVIHRHRPVMVDGLKIVKNLGVNPKRRHKPVRNESS
jgi:hypothetical protein